jgi:hypothetical protein
MIGATWCVMPVLAGPEMTEAAIGDLLVQSVPTKILIVNQGVDDAFRHHLERLSEQDPARIFIWHHQPPLPSLSATWNLALDTIWTAGGNVALVVNNDVRLHPDMILVLTSELRRKRALFVSAVGVRKDQFDTSVPLSFSENESHGGPDFSCFLISRECHQLFRFDESFIPAFCEDLDYHRRLMLAGEGARIFSVNVPYLHLASQTLAQLPNKEAERIRQQIETQSRAYYMRKWGGPVNGESYTVPFNEYPVHEAAGAITTPDLQRRVREGEDVSVPPYARPYLRQQGSYQGRDYASHAECPFHVDQPMVGCRICAEHGRDPVSRTPFYDDVEKLDRILEETNGEATRGSAAERSPDQGAGPD